MEAFETLIWPILLRVLKAFGFSCHFQSWIDINLHYALVFIILNGALKGSCQRDLLSSLLFAIAKDFLSWRLTALVGQNKILPILCLCSRGSLTHILYANDVLFFYRIFFKCLGCYESVSDYGAFPSQLVNWEKSFIYISTISPSQKYSFLVDIYMHFGSLPFAYLCTLLFQGQSSYLFATYCR